VQQAGTFDGHIGGRSMRRKQRGHRSRANGDLVHDVVPKTID